MPAMCLWTRVGPMLVVLNSVCRWLWTVLDSIGLNVPQPGVIPPMSRVSRASAVLVVLLISVIFSLESTLTSSRPWWDDMLPASALAALPVLTRLRWTPAEQVTSILTVLDVPNGRLLIGLSMVELSLVMVELIRVVDGVVMIVGVVVGVVVVGVVGVGVVVGVVALALLGLLLGISELELATHIWFLLWLMPHMAML